jgi:hypothetical protein
MKTLEDYLPAKIWVGGDEKLSNKVQDLLFSLGCKWWNGQLDYEDYFYAIYIDTEKKMSQQSDCRLDYYSGHEYKEMSLIDLFNLEEKKPDHPIIEFVRDKCNFECQQGNVVKLVEMILEEMNKE